MKRPGELGIVLDLDGTVWVDRRLLPGAREAIDWLRAEAHPLLYLTNNPVRPEAYASRLASLGLPTTPAEVLTASEMLRAYLNQTAPGACLNVVGDQDLQEQLAGDFRFSDDPAEIQVVVASSPFALNYQNLTIAFRALRAGARFVATNTDPSCMAIDGGEIPHAGAVVGALEASARRKVEIVAGKPSSFAAHQVSEALDLPPSKILAVGDSLDTDIRFGSDAGMRTALVLTGVTTRMDLTSSALRPDFVLESLGGLPDVVRTITDRS